MPLTVEQQMVVKSPWHYSNEDVYRVMEAFARTPDEAYTLGDGRYHLLMQLHKVAVSRTMPIPVKFGQMIEWLAAEFAGKCARLDRMP